MAEQIPSSSTAGSKHKDTEFVKTLCALEVPKQIDISSNARLIAYSTSLSITQKVGKHPVSTLWVAETGRPNSAKAITKSESNDRQPKWRPGSGYHVVWISDRDARGDRDGIYGASIGSASPSSDSLEIETYIKHDGNIAAFEFEPRNGRYLLFVAADGKDKADNGDDAESDEKPNVWGEKKDLDRLWLVDLESEDYQQGNALKARPITPPSTHVTNFAWSRDGKSIAFAHAASNNIDEYYLKGVELTILELEGLLGEYSDAKSRSICKYPSAIYDLIWAGDGKLHFWAGTIPGRNSCGRSVYAVDPSTPGSTFNNVGFGIENDACGLALVGGEVVVQVEQAKESTIYMLDRQRVLLSREQEFTAFAPAFTDDSDEMVLAVVASDVNTPTEVYSTTASGGGLVRLSNHGAALRDRNLGTCTFLSCPSSDGEVDLDAVFLAPSSAEPGPLPTLVFIHGGPELRVTNSFNPAYFMWTPYLLSLGFGILLPNYRGSMGKGTKYAEYSYGGCGLYDYADVITCTDHAIKEGYADKDRLVVAGWSQGGFLSYLCCTRNGLHDLGWKFQAAIPGAGLIDSDTVALISDLGASGETELSGGRAPWNSSKSDIRNRQGSAIWEFHDAIERSKKSGETIIPPMLILHGEADVRLPVTQAWGMCKALDSESIDFTCVTYPGQPHMIVKTSYWIEMAIRVGEWCKKWTQSSI